MPRAHRRLKLPADHRSPAAARAAVRDVLAETGLSSLLDEALLLTTELSTNGVVHAGTDLDVEVLADELGVTVTVTDFKGGPVETSVLQARPDEFSEHGRGLLLVDQFASSWGTTHDAAGKGVWFRLDADGPTPQGRAANRRPVGIRTADVPRWHPPTDPGGSSDRASADADGGATGPAPERGASSDAYVWLVHMPDELRDRLALPQLVSELLLRLCEVVGARGGEVWLDRGDSRGSRLIARHGTVPADHDHDTAAEDATEDALAPADRTAGNRMSVSLPLERPMHGELVLHGGNPEASLSGVTEADWLPLATLSAERMAIAVESDRLRDADNRRRGWLTFLAEASELLAQSLDVELTLALIPQIVVPRLGEWCAVHITDEWDELRLANCSHTDETAMPVLKRLLASSGSGEVSERLYECLRTGGAVALPRPVEGIAVPLTARGHVLGTLSVGRPPDRLHGPDDVAVVEDVARRASLAIDNARIHAERKEVAQAFQRALLPSALPTVNGIQFGAEYVPASSGADVGGDFYDVIELAPDRWLVSIGDVCGKGPQAAALTGLVRDVIRVLVRDGRPLSTALTLLNRTLLEQHDDGRYCTLATALVSRHHDDLRLELCLAGHDRPILLRAEGGVEHLGIGGTAVGLLDEVKFTESKAVLRPGDSLVFYTDGVTERRRGEELFGHLRLRRELAALARHPAPVVAARLRTAVLRFSGDAPRDDIAILCVRNSSP